MAPRFSDFKNSDLKSADRFQSLLFIPVQQPALIQILTTQTMPGPGYSFQPLLQNGFTAMNAFAVAYIRDPVQGGVDRFQQLPVIGRHRHH